MPRVKSRQVNKTLNGVDIVFKLNNLRAGDAMAVSFF